MDEKLPPLFRLTSEDHGGVGVVAALCTIIISLAVSGIRSIVASKQRVEFQRDDAFFYVASVSTLPLNKHAEDISDIAGRIRQLTSFSFSQVHAP